jgi:hypothetical protein
MLPIIPQRVNKLIQEGNALTSQQFPENLAASMPLELQQDIWNYCSNNYIWPQIQERRPFEQMWDILLQMYKIRLNKDQLDYPEPGKDAKTAEMQGNKARVSDSLVFDAVDRLKNLNHFISWKEGSPIQYNFPRYVETAREDAFYAPLANKIKGANALLNWNINNQDVYRNHLIACQHHYLYGITFINSEFQFEVESLPRRQPNGQIAEELELSKIGVTFEPLSCRKIWLNYRLPAWRMDAQPCPFYFEEMPRSEIMADGYDPNLRPFGYSNLDKVAKGQYIYTSAEMESVRKALDERITVDGQATGLAQLLTPEHSVEAKWTFFPMLPLQRLQDGTWQLDKDGSLGIPMQRFVMHSFGTNLVSNQTIIGLRTNYFPQKQLPLYSSAHMPDLDSGLYTPTMGELLFNHYKEICTAMNQWIDNKNLLNDPPAWYVAGSPAGTMDFNAKGSRIPVNGPNDVGWRNVFNATMDTVQMIQYIRESAQTSSKAVDAILGKAMGSRTSATEASNVFQSAMSGVTTDINIFNYDVMGGYATRVWDYCGLWMDNDLLKEITGQFGFQLSSQDMRLRIGLKWDIGSTYIESIVRQGQYRYILESTRGNPAVRQDKLLKALFREYRLPDADQIVDDGGFEKQVCIATEQCVLSYMGKPCAPPGPDQDHQIAIRVITSFLEDMNSDWNKSYPQNAPILVERLKIHQQFMLIQQQQQMLQMQQMMQMQAAESGGMQNANPSSPNVPTTPGQVTQQMG